MPEWRGDFKRGVAQAAPSFDLIAETRYPPIIPERRNSLPPPSRGTRGCTRRDVQGGPRSMAKFNPFQFLQEVRSETSKVTWPTRKEVMVTTAMVFVLAIVAAIFFTIADQIIRFVLVNLFGIGR
jgi:preprotein translocase subunit SecE